MSETQWKQNAVKIDETFSFKLYVVSFAWYVQICKTQRKRNAVEILNCVVPQRSMKRIVQTDLAL